MILEVFSNLNISVTISNQSRAWCGAQWGSGTLTFAPLAICSELSKLTQLLATDYINGGPSQKAHSPSEAAGKTWRGKNKEEKQGRQEGPGLTMGPVQLVLLSLLLSSGVLTRKYSHVTALYCFIYEPIKKTILKKKSKGPWLIEWERLSVAKI